MLQIRAGRKSSRPLEPVLWFFVCSIEQRRASHFEDMASGIADNRTLSFGDVGAKKVF